jgi:hypothetical protein
VAITNIKLAVAIIAIGVAVGFILSSMQIASAQNLTSTENSKITSLGGPFFIEKGRIIGQRVLSVGPQSQIEFTVVANATINGNISATNTGTTVSTLQDNGVFRSTGQGLIMTEDGEVATYTSQVVGTLTEDGGVNPLGLTFGVQPPLANLLFSMIWLTYLTFKQTVMETFQRWDGNGSKYGLITSLLNNE